VWEQPGASSRGDASVSVDSTTALELLPLLEGEIKPVGHGHVTCAHRFFWLGTDQVRIAYSCTLQRSRDLSTLDVKSLEELQVLKLCGGNLLQTLVGVNTLTALVHIDVQDCFSLKSGLDFTGLVLLQHIDCSYCAALTAITGINTLQSLTYLDLEHCGMLSGVLRLEGLAALKELHVSGCTNLERIHGVDTLVSIERLFMTGVVAQMPTHTDPAVRAKLRALSLSNDGQLAALQQDRTLSALEYLMIVSTDKLTTLDVSGMPALVQLYVKNCDNLQTVTRLNSTSNLKVLSLQQYSQLQQLPHIAATSNLSQLD
jgi:hypothetical protein